MMNAYKEKPLGASRHPRGRYTDERAGETHFNKFAQPLKAAPYSKVLNTADTNSVAVLTGNKAWYRAQSVFWFPCRKLVLPFGENPARFKWPVDGKDCIVYGFGEESEPRDILVSLSVILIKSGAIAVHWGGQYIESNGWDIRLITGPLSENPAPLFLPEG